jgi:thiol:disulfide interchange protein
MARMDFRPSSWLDQLVGACFGLLAAAVALHVAARLIEQVWVVLLVIGGVVAVVVGLVAVLRWRRRGW